MPTHHLHLPEDRRYETKRRRTEAADFYETMSSDSSSVAIESRHKSGEQSASNLDDAVRGITPLGFSLLDLDVVGF